MKKIQWIYIKIVLLFFGGYLCFIPLGSIKIDIYGIPMDVCIGIILVLLTIFKSLNVLKFYSIYILYTINILLISMLIAVAFSEDQLYSFCRFIITCGYIYISFVLPVILLKQNRYVMNIFFLMGVLASAAAIFITQILFPEHFAVFRFNFASLDNPLEYGHTDPNIIGYGIGLTLVAFIYRINLNDSFYKKITYFFSCLLILFVTIFLTQSRTVLFSIVVALFSYICVYRKRINMKLFVTLIFLVFSVLLLFVSMSRNEEFIINVEKRIFGETSAASNTDRIYRLNRSVEVWTNTNLKNFIIGRGYNLERKSANTNASNEDPHNIILAYAYGCGGIGVIAYLSFFCMFYFNNIRLIKKGKNKAGATALFLYIFFASLTYWHTKTFWMTLFFINCIYLEDKFFE